jgi:hypothetical protein
MGRFYNGQPVICVDDRLRPAAIRRYPNVIYPKKGQRYTIRHPDLPVGGKLTFVLVTEIRNQVVVWPCGARFEAGFWEDRFEPATDITLLENIKDFAGIQAERHKEQTPLVPERRRREKV